MNQYNFGLIFVLSVESALSAKPGQVRTTALAAPSFTIVQPREEPRHLHICILYICVQGRIQNLAQGGQTFGARSAPKIFAPPRVFFAPPGGGAKSTPGGAKFFVALCYDYYTPSGSK